MSTDSPHINRLSLVVARTTALLATGMSAWMIYVSIKYHGQPTPWGDFPCIDAVKSRWGWWMKMPIAIPGFVVFLGITILVYRMKPWDEQMVVDRFWPTLIVLVTLAGAAGTWLLGAQLALLRYICPYCLIINLCGMLLFLTFVFFMGSRAWTLAGAVLLSGMVLAVQMAVGPPVPKVAAKPAAPPVMNPDTAGGSEVLVPELGQSERPPNTDLTHIIFSGTVTPEKFPWETDGEQPLTFVPIEAPTPATLPSNASLRVAGVESEPRSLEEVLAADRASLDEENADRTHVTLGKGQVYLKVDEAPFIGSTNAPFVVGLMYDYTQPDSVKMLRFVRNEVVRYKGRLAIALMPVPFEHHCNQNLRYTPEAFAGACDYARASIQVFLTRPDKHTEFQNFVIKDRKAAPLHLVQWMSDKLTDYDKYTAQELQRLTESQIGRNCSYWKAIGHGALPRLLFDKGISTGTPHNLEDMHNFFEQYLGFGPEDVE